MSCWSAWSDIDEQRLFERVVLMQISEYRFEGLLSRAIKETGPMDNISAEMFPKL